MLARQKEWEFLELEGVWVSNLVEKVEGRG